MRVSHWACDVLYMNLIYLLMYRVYIFDVKYTYKDVNTMNEWKVILQIHVWVINVFIFIYAPIYVLYSKLYTFICIYVYYNCALSVWTS